MNTQPIESNGGQPDKTAPRENVYTCPKCHGHTVTVDVDEGVTPLTIYPPPLSDIQAASINVFLHRRRELRVILSCWFEPFPGRSR